MTTGSAGGFFMRGRQVRATLAVYVLGLPPHLTSPKSEGPCALGFEGGDQGLQALVCIQPSYALRPYRFNKG